VFLDFYVGALSNLGYTICGSYTEQVWPPLAYSNKNEENGNDTVHKIQWKSVLQLAKLYNTQC